MESTTWSKLDPALRTELEELLRAPTSAYLSDYYDALGWWLLVFLAALFGAGVSLWSLATEDMSLQDYAQVAATNPGVLVSSLGVPGVVVCTLLAGWALITAARHRERHGYAALEAALVVVRGPRLKVIPYEAVASAERSLVGRAQHVGPSQRRFTAYALTLHSGQTLSLNVTGAWAEEAEARRERYLSTRREGTS